MSTIVASSRLNFCADASGDQNPRKTATKNADSPRLRPLIVASPARNSRHCNIPRMRSAHVRGLRPQDRAEEPDYRHCLLRVRSERPRRRSAEQRYEFAPSHHSITSSASESRLSEILMPSALAVFKLITVSNLVGCNTGSSEGFAPLRIRAV